jgi:NAD(P)-dependent dehydrogenase (short-subunit alcohol dehydrogenase family)
MSKARTALVTGANRGIGLEVCRQLAARGLEVILCAREAGGGEAAAAKLPTAHRSGAEVLDVADARSVDACVARLTDVEVDVLINNAGVLEEDALLSMDEATLRRGLDTHVIGAWRLARAFMPAMNRRGYGRIVNVSSGWASFASGLGPPAYSISKAALNALTVKLAEEAGKNVKVNAADPGWVRTRMGGAGAARSVEQGADTIVWLATLPDDGPSGGFFHDRKPRAW